MNQDLIIDHYKHSPQRCQELEPVHRFNNFVKATLIQQYLKCNGHVLDMPCGKGGDLKKFRENRAAFYAGIDIVQERIDEAKKRHKTTKCMFGALFEVADFTKVRCTSHQFKRHSMLLQHGVGKTFAPVRADATRRGNYTLPCLPTNVICMTFEVLCCITQKIGLALQEYVSGSQDLNAST